MIVGVNMGGWKKVEETTCYRYYERSVGGLTSYLVEVKFCGKILRMIINWLGSVGYFIEKWSPMPQIFRMEELGTMRKYYKVQNGIIGIIGNLRYKLSNIF